MDLGVIIPLVDKGIDLGKKLIGLFSGNSNSDQNLDQLKQLASSILGETRALEVAVNAGFSSIMTELDNIKDVIKQSVAALDTSIQVAIEASLADQILSQAEAISGQIGLPNTTNSDIRNKLIEKMDEYFAFEGDSKRFFLQLPRLYRILAYEYWLCAVTDYPATLWQKRVDAYIVSIDLALNPGSLRVGGYANCRYAIELGEDGFNNIERNLYLYPVPLPGGDNQPQRLLWMQRLHQLERTLIRLEDAQALGYGYLTILRTPLTLPHG